MYLIENYLVQIIIVTIALGVVYACLGYWLATQKGYSSGSWAFLCFCFGPVALMTLGFAPSRYSEAKRIIDYLKQQNEPKNLQHDGVDLASIAVKSNSGDSWVCKKCHEKNPSASSFCSSCGEYK